MSGAFIGAWEKVARGHKHVQELKAEVLIVPGEARNVRFGQQFNPQTNTIEVLIQSVPGLPLEWATIAGDALQNFRAALNYMAWELAKWNLDNQGATRDPVQQTEFPIATESSKFPRHKVADLDPAHVAQIEILQPYDPSYVRGFFEAPNISADHTPGAWRHAVESHPLALLQKLSNADKHRLLQPVGVGINFARSGPGAGPTDEPIDCEITGAGVYMPHALQPGTKWKTYEVRPTGPNPRMNVQNGIFSVAAAFQDGRLVEDTLDAIGIRVFEILSAFEPIL